MGFQSCSILQTQKGKEEFLKLAIGSKKQVV